MPDNNLDSIVNIVVPVTGAYIGYSYASSITDLVPMIAPVQPWLSTGLGLYIGYMLVPKIESFLPRNQ